LYSAPKRAKNLAGKRIARLRNNAAEQDLDPNVWFGNVEVVAAREIAGIKTRT
jgi:membrane-bound lytic murein transglycosylase MltF